MAEIGLTRADMDEQVEVWPDNWEAFGLFSVLMTQWRVGPGGAYGLDYSVIPVVFRLHSVPKSRHSEMFELIQVAEMAALEEMKKSR